MKKAVLEATDHTLLKQTSTWEQIKELCGEAIKYQTAAVCIPPVYVKQAKEFVGDRMKVATVIGFPNGYQTTAVKVFETKDALENGADEIDMVIQIGWVKEKAYDKVLDEIRQIKNVCKDKVLKVIIETCLLTEEEKIEMCRVVTEAGADYIKTSTGFSVKGAVVEDVRLFKEHVGAGVKIKAAGGMNNVEDGERFLEAGADRLGTSRIVKSLECSE